MAERNAERGEVNARIVYWGVDGSGKSTNLRVLHAKLRPDHRGRLEQVATRLDPTVSYERLPIELGEIAGVRTRIQIVAVPGGSEHAPTRKQLLDRVDGIVFVVDARRERIDENMTALEELRTTLAAYGRNLERIPLVVQYNKQDLSDPYVLEELHRKLDVRGAAVFEAVASEGSGVLQTLTTISKRVVRTLRDGSAFRQPSPPSPPRQEDRLEHPASGAEGAARSEPQASEVNRRAAAQHPTAPPPPGQTQQPTASAQQPTPTLSLEMAALSARDHDPHDERDAAIARAQGLLDASWPEVSGAVDGTQPAKSESWRIVSAGSAEVTGSRTVTIPLALADADGRELRLRLTISLESLLD